MNAHEELRRLLNEQGIEWKDGDASYTTEWTNANGQRCSAMYWKPTLSMLISGCTPEQAIAATMNGGECKIVDCGICKFYHADIQLCEYGIPPCSKFERRESK